MVNDMEEIKVIQEAGKVSCDFDTAKAYLKSTLEEYSTAVFTEDSKKEAKAIVADLRKQKKAFTDNVKEVKAKYMEPFTQFEKQAKELIVLFDEPINFISEQIEGFEAKRIAEKRELIKKLYEDTMEEMIEDIKPLVPLDRLYNPKWDNSTFAMAKVKEELFTTLAKVESDFDTIKDFESDIEETALKVYVNEGYDLGQALKLMQNHEKEKAEILEKERERVRLQEESRIREEERAKLEAEQKAEAEKQRAVEEAKAEATEAALEAYVPDDEGETASEFSYRIKLTPSARESLEMYMDSIGIEYQVEEVELPFDLPI